MMDVLTVKYQKPLLVAAVSVACVLSSPVMAADQQASTKLMKKATTVSKASPFYIGLSAGGTHVQPRVNVPNGIVTENKSQGFKFLLGYELRRNYSIEAFYADMGEASIDVGVPVGTVPEDLRVGDIKYRAYGLAVKKKYPIGRSGKTFFFGKLGASNIKNSTDSRITYRQVEPWGMYGSIGLEYEFSDSASTFIEFDYQDTDANQLSIGFTVNLDRREESMSQ